MALPLLECMVPSVSAAATAARTGLFPKRMAFLYVPNGVNMADWTPRTVGAGFELPYILEPLKDLKNDFNILTGLAHENATAGFDGAGDHARASATFLTAARARKTAGADIKVGVSVDQVAALSLGRATPFSSLELGCEPGKQAGNCDSGYSCAYSSNISWRNESTPMAKEVNPKLVFERLFGGGSRQESAEVRARRQRYEKSILDFVMEDAKKLQSNLGSNDRRKLDEYMTGVRELELRIQRADQFAKTVPNLTKPEGVPDTYGDHLKLMADLMVLAFQADLTRVATFVLADDGSNKPYPTLGVSEGHHELSHHGQNAEKKQKIAKINRFHAEHLAYFLTKLKQTQEGDANLMANSMVVYGSGISDGDRHNHDDLPVLVAGQGGGTIQTGRHLRYRKTPMANLYVSLLQRMDVNVESFGDSNGKLSDLS